MRVGVLVVDDSDDIRTVVAMFVQADPRLELVGEAADGAEAVTVARRTQPDAIVLDVRMPVMDGIESLVHLQAVCPQATIVMFSTGTERADEAIHLGAARWFTKDTPVTELLDTIWCLATHQR